MVKKHKTLIHFAIWARILYIWPYNCKKEENWNGSKTCKESGLYRLDKCNLLVDCAIVGTYLNKWPFFLKKRPMLVKKIVEMLI
jgi:hypothetical protein